MFQKNAVWPIDLAGGTLTAALLYAACWYAFWRPETASGQVPTLAAQVQRKQEEWRRLQFALETQNAARGELAAKLRERGRLPDDSPIEQDLRTITRLANENKIRFEDVIPTATTKYPNVLERSYRLRTTGSYDDHLRFLNAFEACSFWADVTHLKLEQTRQDMENLDSNRHSEITLSFFSAVQ